MNWPSLLVFVRHGQSEVNIQSIEEMAQAGVVDHSAPLTLIGVNQASHTGRYIQDVYGKFDQYFVSTFLRTRQTLNFLDSSPNPIDDSRLNEADWGIFM